MNNSLKALADKYETKEFLIGDPSWFMHQADGATNKELLAFIAASLSYGSRKQFIPKIMQLTRTISRNGRNVLVAAHGGDFDEWLTSGKFNESVPHDNSCFYRLYTNVMMNDFLSALSLMVGQYGSIKGYLKARMQTKDSMEAMELLTEWFREHNSRGIIPKDTSSSCKRICMFLRWMVRDNSPVDLGLWSDIIDRNTLIIPMDTHVVQESMRLGLLASKSTSMANARRLTQRLAETFPNDPVRGDYALFGIGVDEMETKNNKD